MAVVLVVEDNLTSQYVLKELVSDFDFNVHAVRTGEEATDACKTTNYACVILSMNLPGLSGFETAKSLRATENVVQHRTAILALTEVGDREFSESAERAGIDDFLLKPFDMETLRRMLLRNLYDPAQPNLKLLRHKPEQRDIG